MALLNPIDADNSLRNPDGSVRFGDLEFTNILHMQLNRIMYCLSLIGNRANGYEYSQNVETLERTISTTESFIRPQLRKDKEYQKKKKQIDSENKRDYLLEHKDRIASQLTKRFEIATKKGMMRDMSLFYLDIRVEKCQAKFELLMDWIDAHGYGFEDVGVSKVKPKR